jgi:hypothetical protein
MSEWTLDVRDPREWEGWRTVATKPSAEACKTYARQKHWVGGQGIPSFRIFDPLGRLLYYSEGLGDGRRMSWPWANFETREQLAAQETSE